MRTVGPTPHLRWGLVGYRLGRYVCISKENQSIVMLMDITREVCSPTAVSTKPSPSPSSDPSSALYSPRLRSSLWEGERERDGERCEGLHLGRGLGAQHPQGLLARRQRQGRYSSLLLDPFDPSQICSLFLLSFWIRWRLDSSACLSAKCTAFWPWPFGSCHRFDLELLCL